MFDTLSPENHNYEELRTVEGASRKVVSAEGSRYLGFPEGAQGCYFKIRVYLFAIFCINFNEVRIAC